MKLSHIAAVAAVAALVSVTAEINPAQAMTGHKYVALGSSYAAGPGIDPETDAGCMRSASNYPQLLAHRIGADLVDVTCSGATTADVLHQSQRLTNGRTMPPQIDAVTGDTTLVTITIGGNDLGLIAGMLGHSCGPVIAPTRPFVAQLAAQVCAAALGAPDEPESADIAAVGDALTRIVETVRSRAPRAEILLVEYLPALDAQATTCPDIVPLTGADAISARHTYDNLIAATRAAAEFTGVRSVHIPDAGQHTACSPDPWVSGFSNPLHTGDLSATAGSYHPNSAGMQAVAGHLAEIVNPR